MKVGSPVMVCLLVFIVFTRSAYILKCRTIMTEWDYDNALWPFQSCWGGKFLMTYQVKLFFLQILTTLHGKLSVSAAPWIVYALKTLDVASFHRLLLLLISWQQKLFFVFFCRCWNHLFSVAQMSFLATFEGAYDHLQDFFPFFEFHAAAFFFLKKRKLSINFTSFAHLEN